VNEKSREPKRRRRGPPGGEAEPNRSRSRGKPWIVGAIAALAAGSIFAWVGDWRPGSLFTRKPTRNVLLITVDTTRADYLSCYGGTATQTPNMDRLAREGALLRNCATSSVMTLPSHCSIMTGLFPFVHGVRRNGVDHLPPAADTLAEAFHAAGAATAAATASYVLEEHSGIAQGFDPYHGVQRPRGPADDSESERKGDRVCDDALALLRARAKEKFFLWVHFYDAHYPYESAAHPDPISPAAYADEVEFMDRQIGRLLDGLRELGLEKDTLVVLVADHGEGLGDHQENQHGYFLYSTCARVPLLVRCPGLVAPGAQVDALVRTVDLAPTILEIAGLPPFGKPVSGVSLVPLLTGAATDPNLVGYTETPEPYTRLRLSAIRALWSGRWKYMWSTEPQLFDLASDPGETHSVIAANAERAAEMQQQLRRLLEQAPHRLPAAPSAPLPSSELKKLESLGYVGLGDGARAAGRIGLEAFAPEGPDPYVHAATIAAYEQARGLMVDGKFAEMEGILRDVLAQLPDALAARRDLAFTLGQLGRLDEAASEYEKAVALAPDDTRARIDYATLRMRHEQWDLAIVQARHAAQSSPQDFAAFSILGSCYSRLGKLDEAALAFEQAVRLEPQVVGTRQALGQIYFQQHRYGQALECFQAVLAADPSSASARSGLAAAQRALGMH
jgi:arylsulfatase A-like enzyme/Flp pilus assembly protein TadD